MFYFFNKSVCIRYFIYSKSPICTLKNFPYQIEQYKRGEYVKQPWFESMPPEMFRTLEKNLGWHLLITAKLK